MDNSEPVLSAEEHQKLDNLIRIGNRAVRKSREENQRLGIPNVYAINGTLIYELPDGTLTTDNPFQNFEQKTD
jgi:hypothetical protein